MQCRSSEISSVVAAKNGEQLGDQAEGCEPLTRTGGRVRSVQAVVERISSLNSIASMRL